MIADVKRKRVQQPVIASAGCFLQVFVVVVFSGVLGTRQEVAASTDIFGRFPLDRNLPVITDIFGGFSLDRNLPAITDIFGGFPHTGLFTTKTPGK